MSDPTFEHVEACIEHVRRGGMLVMVDDEDRENEGDLVIAADHCTADTVNFMAKEGRGLICLALTGERVNELGLPMMVPRDAGSMGTAFTVSIEARRGVTTGISAADRAQTIRVATDDQFSGEDIVSPGHVFPLRAQPGGGVGALRAHRGLGRHLSHGGLPAGRRHLRDHARRRRDGPHG